MAGVRLEKVTKRFGDVVAVHDFTLDIPDGEFVILVGPSGCGKTTALRCIAGLENVTSGEIFIDGHPVTRVPAKNRDMAMVFQNYALYPHMDVYHNMAFCLKLRKTPRDEMDRIIRRTAELLGIGALLKRKPSDLSGGQRQRVALGRAIVRDPKVFLFDEPLSNLDAKLRVAMRAELLDLHQRLKTTAIYVTHDQMEAMTMGDRIVVMNDGLIQQAAPPQEVYDHPVNRFVAGFIGSPAMNFVECRVIQRAGDLYAANPAMSLKIPPDKAASLGDYLGKEVTLGLRPEHFSEASAIRDGGAGSTFQAAVWVVEPLGSEKLVYLRQEGGTLIARLDPHVSVRPGDVVTIAARMDSAHVFDKETKRTIF
ncbi:MAG: sn-glycerol-3-phosphate ABC transporter ATP-binding protein UgpC [Thermodesulfobacteriota bacterium]